MQVGRIRKRLNIESNVSPINDPLSNVYERPIEKAMEALRKNKKKYPLKAFGNNIESPDFFIINNLHMNQVTVDHKKDYPCNRRHLQIYPNRNVFNISSSMSQKIKSKHTYPYTTNTETTRFIEPKYDCIDTTATTVSPITSPSIRLMSNLNKMPRDYDILSNNQKKNTKIYTAQGQYFSRIAALNIFIKDNDTRKVTKRNNKMSDGIYEYLKKNNYVT